MPLKDLLRKKEKLDKATPLSQTLPQASEFTFVRTDTHTEEHIEPPAFGDEQEVPLPEPRTPSVTRRSFGRFRKSVSPSASDSSPEKERKEHKRLSQRLHLKRDRSTSASSVNLPPNLPNLDDTYIEPGDRQEKEAKWEERATILASQIPVVPSRPDPGDLQNPGLGPATSSPARPRSINDPVSDSNIQTAIQLHESGNLEEATEMFGTLADAGNVLSQVLYGLSLRHGWGCQPDPARAVTYLSAAAANSATIESDALKAGMKKGGPAKGELVLAIFELANCFRHGWGVPVDKVAARQYYETAANLGDTDAMNEAAWCYLEGFGGKKDKVSQNFYFNPAGCWGQPHVPWKLTTTMKPNIETAVTRD
ncbi:hypothetical protein A1O1_08175 [Capronia coronata CBS 617.96]|uniref:HCP-like protein n=1 Tax=Capronia coronata CBS 617.96 TaxID=1182541 RepID=W9XYQ0_9EURO|nr:uncharacterized protein A1O1_08175 [Capronia coronata CBS 617.96]EXJ82106.1 hypothetical protein A1O1_08175 [Capronia coronata CBS 617.96]